MENAPLAIVIPALNRPKNLQRLLGALDAAAYPTNMQVPLIFALDQSQETGFDAATLALMEKYQWQYGTKTILKAEQPLGVRKNLLRCGHLTNNHSGVIILEDDLWVSPHFYNAAQKMWHHYKDHPKIGAISLYSFRYNEHAGRAFTPLKDKSDTYFMQTSSSWGQIWWNRVWAPFEAYLNAPQEEEKAHIPLDINEWNDSWKKDHIRYLAQKDLYSVIPRASFSTNMGSPGKHHLGLPNLLQADLASGDVLHHLESFDKTTAIYDAFFEPTAATLQRLFPQHDHPIEADFYGIKPPQALLGKRCISAKESTAPLKRYSHHLRPDVLNLHLPDDNGFFQEALGETFKPMNSQRLKTLFDKDFPNLSGKDGLKHSLSKLSQKFFTRTTTEG